MRVTFKDGNLWAGGRIWLARTRLGNLAGSLLRYRLTRIVLAVAKIVDGLIELLFLGCYATRFEMYLMFLLMARVK